MKRRTAATWEKIKTAYEAGESIASIARAYKTTRNTIKRRARAQGWVVDADRAANLVVQSARSTPQELSRMAKNAVLNIATQRGVEAASGEAIASVSSTIQTLLLETLPLTQRTLDFAKKSLSLSEKMIERAMKDDAEMPPQAWASFTSATVQTAARAMELVRLHAGIKEGTPTLSSTLSEKTRMKRFTIKTHDEKIGENHE